MGIFRNFNRPIKSDQEVHVPFIKKETVKSKDSTGHSFETIVNEEHDIMVVSPTLSMPTTEEYDLETMLKNGDIPREVPVTGILNPTDSSDPRVNAELSNMADQLHSLDENFNINN